MATNDKTALPVVNMTSKKRRRLYDPLPVESVETASLAVVEALVPEVVQSEAKEKSANKIIMGFVKWSAGSSLIPVPVIDMVAVAAIQLMMIKRLCSHYEMEYSKQRVKAIVASLTGSMYTAIIVGSLFKAMPFIGPVFAVASAVAVSGGVTYAVGKVFIKHFEAGGTLLDFDSSRMKSYFESQYKEGRKIVEEIKK